MSLLPTAAIGNQAPSMLHKARGVRPAVTYRTVYLAEQPKNDTIALLLNKHGKFTEVGAVPGAPGGYGLWVDRQRNLYVSNYVPGASKIFEYNDFGDLVFTYSVPGSGAVLALTTDQFGNVFEADGDNSVREFPSDVNTPIATCAPPAAVNGVWGVAVDKQGDVFVDYSDSAQSGNLMEYPKGLIASGCNGTQLLGSDTFADAGGIALDPQRNIVLCDPGNAMVWIVSPPYAGDANITPFISGFSNPINVSITKQGTQAYVTSLSSGTRLLSYPGGTTIASIGSPTYAPTAAVDIYNYVP